MKNQNTSENDDKIRISLPLNKKLLIYVFAVAMIISLVYAIITNPGSIISLIGYAAKILLPLLIGFVLAYLINLILRPVERFWDFIWRSLKNKKTTDRLKRPVCLTSSFILFFSVICAIVFMIAPAVSNTVVSFVNKLPVYTNVIEEGYNDAVDFFAEYNIELPPWASDQDKTADAEDKQPDDTVQNVQSSEKTESGKTTINKDDLFSSGKAIFNTTASLFSILIDICLGFVFAAYILAQKEKFGKQCIKTINAVIKPKNAQRVIKITSLANDAFTRFVTGQLAEACILAILCLIGMVVLGMPNAGIISALIGFTSLIPIFGAFIGAGLGAFLILLEDPVKAFWFLVFIIVLQQIESNLIYPRVVGKSVGLPGVWVLSAVTIGGGLFGVVGMLFSVPICSVSYVLFREFVNKKDKEYRKEAELVETKE